MNLNIIAGTRPSSPTFHFGTISRHPLFELAGNSCNSWEGDPKINYGPDYSQLASVPYQRKHRSAFSHIGLIAALLPKPGCHNTRLQILLSEERERESTQTLALIRHLRVIRLNTAFTLHSAHSSRSAPEQKKMHCMHAHKRATHWGQTVAKSSGPHRRAASKSEDKPTL